MKIGVSPLDPLLARPALVVEGDDIFGRPRHVGDDEADAWIEIARMPFDLGDDPAWLRPASGLIMEARMRPAHMVWRMPDRAVQQRDGGSLCSSTARRRKLGNLSSPPLIRNKAF